MLQFYARTDSDNTQIAEAGGARLPRSQNLSWAAESQTGENSTGEQNLVFSRQYENFLRISEKFRALTSSFGRLPFKNSIKYASRGFIQLLPRNFFGRRRSFVVSALYFHHFADRSIRDAGLLAPRLPNSSLSGSTLLIKPNPLEGMS
jgi:hypothetical protein